MSEVTVIMESLQRGEPQAAEKLLPLVYEELRKLAGAKLAQEKPGQTLQATALVHEAYLRLVGPVGNALRGVPRDDSNSTGEFHSPAPSPQPPAPSYDSRGHFFAAAAEAMRRILIEAARRKRSLKAGGIRERAVLSDVVQLAADEPSDPLDLLALDEALKKLEQLSPRKAELVKLRFFAGLTVEQAAEALGVAPSTAAADWLYAKSWLRLEMRTGDEPPDQ